MTRPSTLERAARHRRREDRRLLLHFALVTMLVGGVAPVLGPWAGAILLTFLPEALGVGATVALIALVLGAGQACVLAPRVTAFGRYVVGTVVAGAPALWLLLVTAFRDDGVLPSVVLAASSGLLLGSGQALALRPLRPSLLTWGPLTAVGATMARWLLRHPHLDGAWSPLVFFLGPATALAVCQTPALAVLLAARRDAPMPRASAG